MSKTRCNQQLCPHQVWEDSLKTTLEIEDINNIALVYTDNKYKSLVKLMDNVILDLQNKCFREATTMGQFEGIRWARAMLEIIKQQVKSNYLLSIKKQDEKDSQEKSALRYAEAQDQASNEKTTEK